jgi:peptide/nickel transport system permease protein
VIQFIVRRLLLAIPTLFGITLLTFMLIRLIPGDAIDFRIGTSLGLSDEQVAVLERYYGLDKSPPEQFAVWLAALARGDLGISLRTGEPVSTLIGRALPITMELAAFAFLLALLIGIPLGTASALYAGSRRDVAVRTVALTGLALPEFLTGTIVVLLFSSTIGWFPNALPYARISEDLGRNFSQNILPAIVIGFAVSASILRFTRASVLEVLNEDHVRVANAKGLARRRIVVRHILRPALIPVVTIGGIMVGYLLTGAVIVEQIFNMPGIGRLLLDSILQRDYPVVQGTILFIAGAFILANLIADAAYAYFDPRIRQRT